MNTNITPDLTPKSIKRPRILTIFSVVVFLFSFFHFFSTLQVFIYLQILQTLPVTISPYYLAVEGLIWGFLGLFLTWSLWTGKPWSWQGVFWVSLITAAYS